jgi:hypothetical protein
MKTLLQLVQEFASRRALPTPATVAGSLDPQVRQYRGLMNELLEELYQGLDWTFLTVQAEWNTVTDEDQGSIDEIAPFGFLDIVKDTIFDRTQRLPIFGPLSSSDYQYIKTFRISGPFYRFRLWNNHLWINPHPGVDHDCAFEYRSKWAVIAHGGQHLLTESGDTLVTEAGNPIGTSSAPSMTQWYENDDDTCVFQDHLMMAGLKAKWLEEKGLPAQMARMQFNGMKANLRARDEGGPKTIYQDANDRETMVPGIWVPAGTWPVSN